ncbi:outer membrane protein assembly factor BamD [Rapidithrix thailandica]|uniref:Outer membrane protein assembly factor BamD n=1 Tax=Rapidithrix thailandica TaxID=413964 RepID=A0AAW9S948_9BACT
MVKWKFILFLAVWAGLSSCSKFTRIMKNPDVDERYEAAMEYYDNEDYYKASLLFEDLLPNLVGSAKAEKVQFYYAYCHFNQKQYMLAAHYFKTFYDTYSRSEFAEEALYMQGFSLYKSTPVFNLDQSNTNEAITAIQDFINRFPQSKYVEEAAELIEKLRGSLEKKSYEIAKQYHKLEKYKAAVIAYGNFQRDFPDSHLREEVEFLKIEAQYDLARLSVYKLKEERYQLVKEYYLKFIDRYPSSQYLKKAENYFESSEKGLKNIAAQASVK